MTVTQAIPVATSGDWNIGGGRWIVMGVCMLFMGVMMFGMMGHTHRPEGRGWPRRRHDTRPGWRGETPMDVLERRFAEGTISVEDYQARRKVLASDAGEANGARKEEPLVAPRVGEGSQE